MHIAKLSLLFFLLVSVVATAQNKPLTPEEIQIFRSEVAEQAASSQTISGKFLQKKHVGFLKNDIESSGKFYFASPDKIKWAYLEPYQYTAIFKNDQLYINDGGKKSSIDLGSNVLFEKLNNLIVNSINGKMLKSEDFEITYAQNETHYIANLRPTNEVILKLFKTIELTFDKTNFTVDRVKLMEPSGDYTQIYFQELQLNTPIDASVFEL